MEIKTMGSFSTASQRMVVMHSLSHAKLDEKQPFSSPRPAMYAGRTRRNSPQEINPSFDLPGTQFYAPKLEQT